MYSSSGNPDLTYTCTETDCSNCVGISCSDFTLTVSTEGAVSDLSPVSDCKHGDTVKLEYVGSYDAFGVNEIAIVGKPDCNEVDSDLKVIVGDFQLPVRHGTEVQYSCPQNSLISDGNVKAVCTDGKILLSPENVLPCREPST
ncbi:hypothetical protein ACHWQZ_G006523 [Mnemiopsis leidyi]